MNVLPMNIKHGVKEFNLVSEWFQLASGFNEIGFDLYCFQVNIFSFTQPNDISETYNS